MSAAIFAAHDPAGGPLVDARGVGIQLAVAELARGLPVGWNHPPHLHEGMVGVVGGASLGRKRTGCDDSGLSVPGGEA